MTKQDFIKKFNPLLDHETKEIKIFTNSKDDLDYVQCHIDHYIWSEVNGYFVTGFKDSATKFIIAKSFFIEADKDIKVSITIDSELE